MSFDPFHYQKEMMKQMEAGFSDMVQKIMREPSFMQNLSQNMGAMLDIEGIVRKHIESILKAYKIPTQQDLDQIYATLNRVESAHLDLEEELNELKSLLAQGGVGDQQKSFQTRLAKLEKDQKALKSELKKIQTSKEDPITKTKVTKSVKSKPASRTKK